MKTKLGKFTIEQLSRRRSNIDLDPTFQRESVWRTPKQQYFIDSILKGWGTPKIYLAIKNSSNGDENYSCIDGKQRLLAIFYFLNGKFGLSKKLPSDYRGKHYKKLPGSVRDRINNYQLAVEKVFDATDEELGELFIRLQRGVVLNSAEQLRATNNKVTRFITSLTKHEFFLSCISLPNTRYAHFAVAAQLSLLNISGKIVSVKYGNLERFFKNYPNFYSKSMEARQIKDILTYLHKVFRNNSKLLSNRANIVSVFVLISEMMKRGNINGKEKSILRFFKRFIIDLEKTASKDQLNGDPVLLRYQNATIQAADSSGSIRIRHEILLDRLANYSTAFKRLLNITTDEEKFKELYNKLESKHSRGPTAFNNWLLTTYPNVPKKNCRNGLESLPVHVRHSIHHPQHPKYTKRELVKALKILESIN